MGQRATLPVYEVEYIPVERRVFQRCGPLDRLKTPLANGERRTSPGRRKEDWDAFRAAGYSLSS